MYIVGSSKCIYVVYLTGLIPWNVQLEAIGMLNSHSVHPFHVAIESYNITSGETIN